MADLDWLDQYNSVWTKQSRNAGESMPVSGGDVGLNVWVENDEILIYLGRAGYRDENGALLKPGRIRLRLFPNLFDDASFKQELRLPEGCVLVTAERPDGKSVTSRIWADVFRPVAHFDIEASEPIKVQATYESWRTETIELEQPNDGEPLHRSKHGRRAMCMINYDAYPGQVFLYGDEIRAEANAVRFHHRVDNSKDCFEFQVKQQGLEEARDQLVNPLKDLTWGGALVGDGFSLDSVTDGIYAGCPFEGWRYIAAEPAKSHRIRACMHIDQVGALDEWDSALDELIALTVEDDERAREENLEWWHEFWSRSRLIINPGRGAGDDGWRVGRNYQLFRYMLASNVTGREPTQFNGGTFTFDPLYVNGLQGRGYTPDHRQWGAAFTGQNQRMVVWPLLKTGDFDFMSTAFRFHMDGLQNATARVRHYWGHDGCAFEEQSALTALPGSCQYGFHEGGKRGRPADLDLGDSVNQAGGMIFEQQLEYAWLMLRYCQFSGADVAPYLPFVEKAVVFYDEHYRYHCKRITGKELDDDGKLVIYPANTLECHWEARNPTSVVTGLRRILSELVLQPDELVPVDKKAQWQTMLDVLPDMPTDMDHTIGGTFLKPSANHDHLSGHCPEMYPLYPYELYGIGLPDLDLMKRTSLATGDHRFETDAWQQANIHAARLGDTELAKKLNTEKMDNGPFRFPAFWPENIDWAPDHNWGGCGMIGLQEMLMQTHAAPGDRGKIRLLPAWPDEWDVEFRMHAPYGTVVEGSASGGKMTSLDVIPESRKDDVEIML